MTPWIRTTAIAVGLLLASCSGCGNEADNIGVGAECSTNDDCNQDDGDQQCLSQFKGGYCGLEGCDSDDDCPEAAACVTHEGANYCFRVCVDKEECNENRSDEFLSNCSSSVTFADGSKDGKACLPPSN